MPVPGSSAVLRPATENELAEAVRDADGPLAVRGGGTRPVGRPLDGDILETGGLATIPCMNPAR